MNQIQFLTLRKVFENDLSQLDIEQGAHIISELKNMGFIEEKDASYSLTNDGLDALKPYVVDNAIIMAAGFGSRFIPYTYKIPKGLLEVNGEILIERQIEQLLEVGITEIVLVVGYLKDKFQYLVEKYNVQLVENPDYSIKNNISTIYYAGMENLLKNSYILTSDIRMAENVYHKHEYHSWYALKYFEGETQEWPVVLDEDSKITAVQTHGKDTLCIYGPTYLKSDFSALLYKKIKEIYEDESKKDYYWENVFIDSIEAFELFGNILKDDVVEEFECFEELIEFDNSYIESPRNTVIETICNVLKVKPNEIKSIESLKIGMTNDSFCFTVNNQKYVYRMPGEGTELLINRYNEANVYKAIKHLNLSDEIVYLSPEDGTKISKFIVDSKMIDISYLNEMIKILKSLHTSGIVVEHSFEIIERVEHYKKLCEQEDSVYFEGYEEINKKMDVLKEYIHNSPVEYVFCHIDGIVVNFLETNEGLRLLDWEYSGMSDPFMDLAMNVLYSYLDTDEADALLETYLERKPSKDELKRYYALISLTGMLWALWTIYKEALGDKFGSYGQEQFDFGKLYLEKFNNVDVKSDAK